MNDREPAHAGPAAPVRHASPTRSFAVTGSGGNGAVTTGLILLEAAGRAGWYGLLGRSAGPQIRGGESAVMLTLGAAPVRCPGECFDLLAALDWGNFQRFSDELPLADDALVLADPDAGRLPEPVAAAAGDIWLLPLQALARELPGGRANMVALGAVGALAGLPLAALLDAAAHTLTSKGHDPGSAVADAIRVGFAAGLERGPRPGLAAPPTPAGGRWNISGNEAAGLGALRGGVRFVAAYPITPASEMLEWLAPRLEAVGGALLQAEDELASIHMIIGAAWGGVPALTATSGPGLSLMVEGIGLAVASETPVVVADVMRVGPSTGIATKSEQSDLALALDGLHGDAPHLVLAAQDIADCAFTFDWATRLAERLQTAAIVLSDQSLGQSRAIIDPPHPAPAVGGRRLAAAPSPLDVGPNSGPDGEPDNRPAPFLRYADQPDGVSPMSVPGQPGLMYTADGLEHDPRGTPSSRASDHLAQLDKRRRKLATFDYGPHWARIDDGPDLARPPGAAVGREHDDLCLITWGSSFGPVLVAARALREAGRRVRVVAPRLLAPLARDALRAAIGTRAVLVVEQNQTGQFFRYLHAGQALPDAARSFARPGPLPLRPAEIIRAVTAIRGDGSAVA